MGGQVPNARPQTGYRSSLSFGDRQADHLYLHRTRRRGRSHHSRLVNGLVTRVLAPTLLPMTLLPMTSLPAATRGLDMRAHTHDSSYRARLVCFRIPSF